MWVRVVDMRDIDLNRFVFDYDLTFAILLMHPDGTLYHTYGGRDWTDAQSHLSIESLARVLERTAVEHAAHKPQRTSKRAARSRTIQEFPIWKKRIQQGKAPECFHCHMVNEGDIRERKDNKTWRADDRWFWPDPIQIGLEFDRDEQQRVISVEAKSAAAKAGLEEGDRLTGIGGANTLSFSDVTRVLYGAPSKATRLPIEWTHDGEEKTAKLRLGAKWKEATPIVYAWRASKWPLSPKPGFGGQPLNDEQKAAAGLDPKKFAFRIGYLVTWGDNAYTGRNAVKAGLRKGDIVYSVGGKTDFQSMQHFHAWVRLTKRPGDVIEVLHLRNGRKLKAKLRLLE